MKRLDLNLLATFVAIAESGGLTKAAIRRHKTQAAISIQLKKLEEITGKPLLRRKYNDMSLTRDGEVLLDYARKILALTEEAYDVVSGEDLEGVVRLGIPDDYARLFLPPVIQRFVNRYPQVRLKIKSDVSWKLFADIENGDLDLVLVTRSESKPGGTILRRENIFWVASKTFNFAGVQQLPLALYPQGCTFRERVLKALTLAKQDWLVAVECSGVTAFDVAIDNNLAISATCESLMHKDWQVIKPSDFTLPQLEPVEIELHTNPEANSKAIKYFADEISRYVQNL